MIWLVCLTLFAGASDSPRLQVEDATGLAEAAWSRRDSGFAVTGKVDSEAATEVVRAWQQALELEPDDPLLTLRLVEAIYFKGHFASDTQAESSKWLDRQLALSEEALSIVLLRNGLEEHDLDSERAMERFRHDELAADALLWTIVSEGMWAMEHKLAAALKGTPDRLLRRSALLDSLDETYGNAAGHRLLGRLHTATPRVPGFTSWVDPTEGICHLRRAWELSREDPRNGLFLAEALLTHRSQGRDEAIRWLEEIVARTPDPSRTVEETEILSAARRRLGELTDSRNGK